MPRDYRRALQQLKEEEEAEVSNSQPCAVKIVLTFDSLDRFLSCHWKAVEQCFVAEFLIFQFFSICNFSNFGLGTLWSERINSYSLDLQLEKKETGFGKRSTVTLVEFR